MTHKITSSSQPGVAYISLGGMLYNFALIIHYCRLYGMIVVHSTSYYALVFAVCEYHP